MYLMKQLYFKKENFFDILLIEFIQALFQTFISMTYYKKIMLPGSFACEGTVNSDLKLSELEAVIVVVKDTQ